MRSREKNHEGTPMIAVKTTCEYHDCDAESTHVAHWEEVGAPGPVFLCRTHALRRRSSVTLRVETIEAFTSSDG